MIESLNSTTSTYSSSSTQETANADLDQADFMLLLVEQMKNQDPFEPMSNEAQLAQLAQFESLDQMEQLNENIVGLAVLQQENALAAQVADSSAIIGKQVSGTDIATGEQFEGIVESVTVQEGMVHVTTSEGSFSIHGIEEVKNATN